MEKRKAKKQEAILPNKLLFSSPFEFISPLPVEECAYRLHEMNGKRTGLFSPKLATYIFCNKENEYSFYLRQMSKKAPVEWAIGSLSVYSADSTTVSGQVGIPATEFFPRIIFVPLALFSIFLLVINLGNLASMFSFLTLLWGVALGIYGAGTILDLRNAKRDFTKVLTKNLDVHL